MGLGNHDLRRSFKGALFKRGRGSVKQRVVRIQKRLVKKRYYGKSVYQYVVYSLNLPKEFHELLPAFLEKDLDVDVQSRGNSLTITLTLKLEKPWGENAS